MNYSSYLKPGPEKKQDVLLDGLDDEEEEIVDLVEVVEEPEAKISIDDFIAPAKTKTEPIEDIEPLESWGKLFKDEKKPEERSLEGEPSEKEFEFSIKKKWPSDTEIDKKVKEALPGPGPELQSTLAWTELRDFETALKAGVKGTEETGSGEAVGEGLQPFSLEEAKEEGKDKYSELMKDEGVFAFEEFRGDERKQPPESLEFEKFGEEEKRETAESVEKPVQAFTFEESGEEESVRPAESMFDEIQSFIRNELRKETPLEIAPGLSELPETPLTSEGTPVAEMAQPVEIDLEEEALGEQAEEEVPDSFIEELGEDEIRVIGEPGKESREEKEEEVKTFHEGVPSGFPHELESPGFVERVHPSSLLREGAVPKADLEEVRPQTGAFDRQLEEVMGKGVQEMMEGFITKVLPQMTQNIFNLTVERIKAVVKEIVPDLAEKAIQEEIRRLQKGDKE